MREVGVGRTPDLRLPEPDARQQERDDEDQDSRAAKDHHAGDPMGRSGSEERAHVQHGPTRAVELDDRRTVAINSRERATRAHGLL